MSIYVTAETVSPGHPDKIADLISDYVLTKALQNNGSSRVAVETFLTGTKNGGLVLVGGEISEKLYTAVAVALAYIYKIDRGEFASEPEIIIPQDMQFNEQGQLLEDNWND